MVTEERRKSVPRRCQQAEPWMRRGKGFRRRKAEFVHNSDLGAHARACLLPFLNGALVYSKEYIGFFFEKKEDYFMQKTIEELHIGDSATLTKTFLEADVFGFAKVSGDNNPAHVDAAYAKTTVFQAPIVHGFLVGSLFSAILGTLLPGLGTIYTGQTLKFTKPVYFDDSITATVQVKEIILEKNRVIFDCLAKNQRGETVLLGEATVMPPKKSN
jgi:3-hydroxybutyryl-CoA dehydratase